MPGRTPTMHEFSSMKQANRLRSSVSRAETILAESHGRREDDNAPILRDIADAGQTMTTKTKQPSATRLDREQWRC